MRLQFPKLPIVVLTHTHYHYSRTPDIKKFDDLVEKYVISHPNFHLCDIRDILPVDQPDLLARMLLPDMVHMTPLGYEKLAQKVNLKLLKISKK